MKKILILTIFSIFLPVFSLQAVDTCEIGPIELQNGSFENPLVTNEYNWNIFPNETENLYWQAEWLEDETEYENRPESASIEIQKGIYPWAAKDGNQYAELDSDWDGPFSTNFENNESSSIKIFQDIETIVGAKYKLSFSFSAHPNTTWIDNILEISWDDSVVDTVSASGTSVTLWHDYSYIVEAKNELSRISFSDLGKPDSFGTFLDNINLELLECPQEEEKDGVSSSSGGGIVFSSQVSENTVSRSFVIERELDPCEKEALEIVSVVMKPENSKKELELFKKVYDPNLEVGDTRLARLSYFIGSEGACSAHLGAGERAGVVNSYKAAFESLPLSFEDWLDVLKIANGRWPSKTNERAVSFAKQEFASIYLREANLENQNDYNAVSIIAYGLRPVPRDIEKEKLALDIYRSIKASVPVTASEWDLLRAIAYSGAKR